MKRGSSMSTKKKISESSGGGVISNEVSDRLRMLALPNCHLVEAVLKQHSHVFTDDCRDRLRNLLQVIVSVNSGHKRKFEQLNERLNFGPIKNFKERLEDIEAERRGVNEIKEVQTEVNRFSYGPCTSSMVCNVSSSLVEDSVNIEDLPSRHDSPDNATGANKESKTNCKPGEERTDQNEKSQKIEDDDFYADKKIFAKDELYATYTKTADAYRLEFINECVRTYTAIGAEAGDCDSDLEVLYERLSDFNDSFPREFGDSAGDSLDQSKSADLAKQSKTVLTSSPAHQSRRDSSPDSTRSRRSSSQIPRSVRARNLSAPHEERKSAAEAAHQHRRRSVPRQDAPLSPIPERRTTRTRHHHHHHHHHHTAGRKHVINVPSLAVRAYVALVMNMQRNCALYKTFRNDMIKPVEYHKQPYITAAYECWMDYMVYVKNTLDYLHPYIMNLVHAYYTRDPNDPELADFKTKLPKVLINSMKDIQTWNGALNESIECCRRVFRAQPSRTDVHHLYERHYHKLDEVGVHFC